MGPDFALLQRAVTVLLNLALAVLVGGSAALLWLRPMRSAWATARLARLRKALLAATAGAAAAYAAILWIEAASMAEVPLAEALPAVRSVLGATHYGLAWMVGAAALAVVAAASAAEPRSRTGGAASAIRIAALGVLLYSRSMVSHAGAGGDLTWAVAVDWMHLVLVSVWVGDVIVAGWLTLRQFPASAPANEPAATADRARYIGALSRSATFALAGILLTGGISAWRALDSPADLVGNPYGTALLVKLGLVLGAAALGGYNRFVLMPSLLRSLRAGQAESGEGRSFARILQIEALVLAATFVVAAFLTSTSPPMA